MSNTEAGKVAATILDQIGHTALRMIGARNLVALDELGGVQFNIGRNREGVNKIVIKLTPADVYDVEFWRIRGTACKILHTSEGVYNDGLTQCIEIKTGMFTSL